MSAPFILASASPRRLALLRQIGIEPSDIDPAEIDKSPLRSELPGDHALRLAKEKLQAVQERHPASFIVAADTVVACGRRILPKAEDPETAHQCMTLISGRRHRVLGGMAVAGPDGRVLTRLVETVVAFRRLDRSEIDDYVASADWHGKAGGYAIQGRAAAYVRFISGSYSNVVGLSLYDVSQMLSGIGWRPAGAG